MPHKTVLILGVGSPFGADRLGWLAVEALTRQPPAAEFSHLEIRFEQSDRPGSRLLALLGEADAAIIIDAMCAGLPAGSVRRFAAAELGADSGLMSSHGFGIAESLALGHALAGSGVLRLPPQLAVLGIEMADAVDPEHTLDQWFPALHRQVAALLEEWG
jgi:hydrogenase maturation protease